MNFKIKLTKGLLLFVFLISACKKDKQEFDSSILLVGKLKEEQVQYAGDIKFKYFYDNDRTLNKQELWAGGMLVAANEYRYLDGKLYFRTHLVYTGQNVPLKVESVSKYTYSGDLLTEAVENVLERKGEESDISTRFTYDERGFIQSARQARVTSEGTRIVVYHTFTTDEEGNVLKIKELTTTNGKAAKSNMYTMQYDDKHNPRYNLIDPLEFSQFFSPNNVVELNVKTTAEERSTQFRYLYTPQQMPVSMEANDVIKTEFRDLVKWVYY